jgi:hypothetical protein
MQPLALFAALVTPAAPKNIACTHKVHPIAAA